MDQEDDPNLAMEDHFHNTTRLPLGSYEPFRNDECTLYKEPWHVAITKNDYEQIHEPTLCRDGCRMPFCMVLFRLARRYRAFVRSLESS